MNNLPLLIVALAFFGALNAAIPNSRSNGRRSRRSTDCYGEEGNFSLILEGLSVAIREKAPWLPFVFLFVCFLGLAWGIFSYCTSVQLFAPAP